jgi:SAM-dependent methyltransferase
LAASGTDHVERARAFDAVADAYDRARPTYPREVVAWLTGGRSEARVLELGAGTGKLTEQLVACGHSVTATDASETMLARLRRRAPAARAVAAVAEVIPTRRHTFDAVACAQAFHWFRPEQTLREVARVLRPSGVLGLVWNVRDERVPWVRRLGAILGDAPDGADPKEALDGSGMFASVEETTARFWQPLTRTSLRELALSRSNVATLRSTPRNELLGRVDELYNEYGRGPDGMLLPYVTKAYRTVVLPWAIPEEPEPAVQEPPVSDSLLIDFS